MRISVSRAILMALISTTSLSAVPAWAIPGPGIILPTSDMRKLSRDGLSEYYWYTDFSGFANFWTPSTGNVLVGDLPGGADWGFINDMTADGSIVVGYSDGGIGFNQAFYWTAGTGIVALPVLPGGSGAGVAAAVSRDGSTVVGHMENASALTESFYWTAGTGTVGLGFSPGWSMHNATDVSDDGSAIAGNGLYMGGTASYHWNATDGMTLIPLLPPGVNPSSYNQVEAISGDGLTVVGYNEYMFTGGEAFIWSQATGVIGMGYLGSDTLSSATFVNYDGSMAYGYSFNGDPVAFRWTPGTGPVAMSQIMSTAGIDMSDTNIRQIWSASDDGLYVTGSATEISSGIPYEFIANLNALNSGIITPQDLAESVGSMPTLEQQATQKTIAQVGQSLFAARLHPIIRTPSGTSYAMRIPAAPEDISPEAGGSSLSFFSPQRTSAFVVGSLVAGQDNDLDNWGVNGLAGFKFAISEDFSIGIAINGAKTRTNGIFDSHSDIVSKGGSLLTSYEPDSGLRLYTSLFGAKLDVDTHRGYDAGAVDYSRGETEGHAFGGAARLGWEVPVTETTSIQPYVEAHLTRISIDGYTEEGGSFPATFSEQSETTRLGKLGIEGKYKFSPTLHLTGQVAYVHSSSSSGANVQTSVGGLTFAGDGGDEGDMNWGELTLGAQWAASDTLQFSAEISGRSGDTAAPQMTGTLGLTYNF